jgi:hypothetical protein
MDPDLNRAFKTSESLTPKEQSIVQDLNILVRNTLETNVLQTAAHGNVQDGLQN